MSKDEIFELMSDDLKFLFKESLRQLLIVFGWTVFILVVSKSVFTAFFFFLSMNFLMVGSFYIGKHKELLEHIEELRVLYINLVKHERSNNDD